MANKKISELPYINSGEISGNTLVPLVTYFSAATGDTVHTYVSDLGNYLINGSYLPLTGGTVSGGTIFSTNGGASLSIDTDVRSLYDVIGLTSMSYDDRKLIKSSSDVSFDWENGILTGQTNIESSTISATTYLNLPNGYYDTTGITSSQSITWDKTYWGISGSSNVDITLPSTTSKDGHILIIKDESGLAGSYRIRVTPLSGTIDGNTYIDMNINYMSLTFVARNNNWWII